MKVFVTGGSGYVGRETIRALRRRGHDVTALVRGDHAAEVVAGLGATPVTGTLRDLAVLSTAAADADGAIHLAVERGPRAAEIDAGASAAIQDGIGAGPYVHTGGVWVYGNTNGLVNEDAPQSPPSVVAWRSDNEKRVLSRAASGGRPVLIERFFTGPARTRHMVRIIGGGSNHWSLVHVDDIAELYALALGARAGSVYAGVAFADFTVAEIAEAVSQAAGCAGRVESVSLEQAREEMVPIADAFALDQQVSSARARDQLGWNPPNRDVLREIAEAAT